MRRGGVFSDLDQTAGRAKIRFDERIVKGYHGTSVERADSIIETGRFVPSRNDWDWLGHGIYFWEHAPLRALQWARARYRHRAIVLEATIALSSCLDLNDLRYTSAVRIAYDSLRDAYLSARKPLPANRRKARYLDCLVLNYLSTYILPECESIRAPFLEGEPIYEGSMLLSQSHIQLVVRAHSCILSGPKIVAQEVFDGFEFEIA